MIFRIINFILFILSIKVVDYTEKYAKENGFTDENFDEVTIKKYKKELTIRAIIFICFMLLVCLIADDVTYSLGCFFFLAVSNLSLMKKYLKLKLK